MIILLLQNLHLIQGYWGAVQDMFTPVDPLASYQQVLELMSFF